jgi:hypothetical protein
VQRSERFVYYLGTSQMCTAGQGFVATFFSNRNPHKRSSSPHGLSDKLRVARPSRRKRVVLTCQLSFLLPFQGMVAKGCSAPVLFPRFHQSRPGYMPLFFSPPPASTGCSTSPQDMKGAGVITAFAPFSPSGRRLLTLRHFHRSVFTSAAHCIAPSQ